MYTVLRIRIFGNIPPNDASYKLLLYGSKNYCIETYRHMLLKIQKIIKESKCFQWLIEISVINILHFIGISYSYNINSKT